MWNEPHYDLPLLSVLPRPVAHLYIRASGKASYYHEKHLTYWALKRLVREFEVHDYTRRLIRETETFKTEYMLPSGSLKSLGARTIARFAYWALPGYIWLLRKRAEEPA